MKDYIQLLRIIGIPNRIEGSYKYNDSLRELSRQNKIEMFYNKRCNISRVKDEEKYKMIIDTVCEFAELFNNKIDYAIFKTLKPFPYIPSDIDILVRRNDIEKINKLLYNRRYTLLEKNRFCISIRRDVTIDLYIEPSVSNIAYLRTDLLLEHIRDMEYNGISVTFLKPEAEIVGIISHSYFKEQMVTLNDYYALVLLAEMANMDDIIKLADDANISKLLTIYAAICKTITNEAFGRLDLKINLLADKLGYATFAINSMPYKFQIKNVMLDLFAKLRSDGYSTSELLKAFTYTLHPSQILKVIDHIRRDTY